MIWYTCFKEDTRGSKETSNGPKCTTWNYLIHEVQRRHTGFLGDKQWSYMHHVLWFDTRGSKETSSDPTCTTCYDLYAAFKGRKSSRPQKKKENAPFSAFQTSRSPAASRTKWKKATHTYKLEKNNPKHRNSSGDTQTVHPTDTNRITLVSQNSTRCGNVTEKRAQRQKFHQGKTHHARPPTHPPRHTALHYSDTVSACAVSTYLVFQRCCDGLDYHHGGFIPSPLLNKKKKKSGKMHRCIIWRDHMNGRTETGTIWSKECR